MKRNIALLLLALLFLMPYSDVNARRRKKYYPVSYMGGYAGVGYSQLMHDIPTTTISGGGAGLLGFEYFVKYGKKDNYLNNKKRSNLIASFFHFLFLISYYKYKNEKFK